MRSNDLPVTPVNVGEFLDRGLKFLPLLLLHPHDVDVNKLTRRLGGGDARGNRHHSGNADNTLSHIPSSRNPYKHVRFHQYTPEHLPCDVNCYDDWGHGPN